MLQIMIFFLATKRHVNYTYISENGKDNGIGEAKGEFVQVKGSSAWSKWESSKGQK